MNIWTIAAIIAAIAGLGMAGQAQAFFPFIGEHHFGEFEGFDHFNDDHPFFFHHFHL